MFDLDATAAPDNGVRWDDTISVTVTDECSGDAIQVYVTGDGTERAAWALRSYVRSGQRGDARPPRPSA